MLFVQLLFASLLVGSVMTKDWDKMTDDEKSNAGVGLIICICVGVAICISISAAAGFFYMMRKRNSNQQGGVMVVH